MKTRADHAAHCAAYYHDLKYRFLRGEFGGAKDARHFFAGDCNKRWADYRRAAS